MWYQWVPFYFWVVSAAFFFPYLIYKQYGVNELKPVLYLLNNSVSSGRQENMRFIAEIAVELEICGTFLTVTHMFVSENSFTTISGS